MPSFNKTQRALLECLRFSISGVSLELNTEKFTAEEWRELLFESRIQAVDILCYDTTEGKNLPADVSTEWLRRVARLFANNYNIQRVQQTVADLLDENSVPYVILKGLASAYYYPNPGNRNSGDIDVLVPEEHMDKTETLFLKHGAERHSAPNENHVSFSIDGVEIELHRTVSGIPKNEFKEVYTEYFNSIYDRAVIDEKLGFKKPCDSMHGVIILLHTIHHVLSKGIGLRHLCDWACYVAKTHEMPFWEDELIPLFRKTGLLKFAFILTEISAKYLGIARPKWLESTPETASEMFLREVFRGGNFGKRAKNKPGTDIMVTNDRVKKSLVEKTIAIVKKLHSVNKANHPIVRKAPFLSPFFGVWRIIRYTILMVRGKRESLFKSIRYAEGKNLLVQNFGLYEVTDD